ncbi:cell envelope integrity protein TolA [Salinicoccus roseus]|uniref:Cell envelope integrity protein TolA n=1 Tax=Salinicoccus roseus TaxID=45670 RepID=A0ABT4YLE5_9STAP|nr:cell envelope integrity protein TolA [Salinicoccus roseus]MDB0581186.1 cell envelope integrity protein TolA [Salinicoccus roseus]
MTILLALLWALAGLSTVALLLTASGLAIFKKNSKNLWIATGVSAILFIMLFFGTIFSNQRDLSQTETTASNNQQTQSDQEPQTTELYREEQERMRKEESEEPANETVAAEENEADGLEEEIEKPVEKEFNASDYQSDVDISELERRPDDFSGQNFMYRGKIVQVMEDEPYTAYRVAINDDYDHVAYIQMFSSTLDQRYLDDDYITFYGYYEGLLSYETVIGGEETVPAFTVNGSHIELNQQ